jgi:hypothetical protein
LTVSGSFFVITKIITAGITWLISLLNPAAAFIKACKLIYDAVMWFVDNAARLKDFVDSILDSVESIAAGGVGAVAQHIENTLSKMIPMLISGLASLLGLGGIADKIKAILETVQRPVGRVVDKLVGTAVGYGKKLLNKLKGLGKKKDTRSPGERKAALTTAMTQGQAALTDKKLSETAIRSKLATIKRDHKIKQLDLVVDSKTPSAETAHIVGANSPRIHGPRVTRMFVPVIQRADEDLSKATGPETKIDVGGEIFTVWTVGGRSVRVRIEAGETVDIRSDASVAAAIKNLTSGHLEMDESQAKALADALAERGMLARQLLLQFVSNKSHGQDPEEFAKNLAMTKTATRAAIQRPVGKAGRDLLVDKGKTSEGEQHEGPLCSIAHVFYPRKIGEWKSGQIQKTAGEGAKGIEFVWQGQDTPKATSLGVIEIDDDGAVIRIISAEPEAGGKDGLLKIMQSARWPLKLTRA